MYSTRGAANRFVRSYLIATILTIIAAFTFLYFSIVPAIEEDAIARVNQDLKDLHDGYRAGGAEGAAHRIRLFLRDLSNYDAIYLLLGKDGQKIAGNIDLWPDKAEFDKGWQMVSVKRSEGSEPTLTGLRAVRLSDNDYLLVGRDARAIETLRRSAIQSLTAALAMTTLIAVGGGHLLSRFLLRKVKNVAITAEKIMQGDLSGRIPQSTDSDEFDQLAKSLNEMLSHIENLMESTRSVTDGIAHDFRSPLTRIKTRLEVVSRREHPEDELRAAIASSLAEIDELLSTLNALMEIVRAEGKLSREQMTTIDLSILTRDVGELYQPLAEDKGLCLEINAGEPLSVHGHPALLAQAVSNLIDNAVKYTPSGETITLTTALGADGPFVAVADRGPGIPEDKRGEVIKRFIRLDDGRSTPGVGLGLSLVAAVAKQHGAQLVLGDNQPGLRAVLRFPISKIRK